MSPVFRVIDTGLRDGAANIAFDAALIEAHKAGVVPDTIRFLQFRPTALVGRHQALSQEIRVDYCAANGVGLARRITGGGALYMDEGQFGFELAFRRATLGLSDLGEVARAICEAAAAGLQKLGVAARYRPRNDIEVEGRKISGTGGFFDGDTLFYQGTVLVDMDPSKMIAALNVPAGKLAKRGLETAERRIVTLRELKPETTARQVKAALLEGFREKLGIDPRPGDITAHEESLARKLFDEEIGTEAFLREIDAPEQEAGVVRGQVRSFGGEICAYLRFEGPRRERVREALVTGDFFVTPPRVILDLEAALRGVERSQLRAATLAFFAEAAPGILSARPEDFAEALEAAAQTE